VLPTLAAYGRGLPDGWRSYPECRASATLLSSLEIAGALDGLDALPEELASYIGPVPSGWIPEVVHVAILLAIRDRRFVGESSEDAFITWLHRLNTELLRDRSEVGPDQAVLEFPALWASLHQGTRVQVQTLEPGHALLASFHPEPLFPALANRWRRDAVASHLARAGAVQPRVSELGRRGDATWVDLAWT